MKKSKRIIRKIRKHFTRQEAESMAITFLAEAAPIVTALTALAANIESDTVILTASITAVTVAVKRSFVKAVLKSTVPVILPKLKRSWIKLWK